VDLAVWKELVGMPGVFIIDIPMDDGADEGSFHRTILTNQTWVMQTWTEFGKSQASRLARAELNPSSSAGRTRLKPFFDRYSVELAKVWAKALTDFIANPMERCPFCAGVDLPTRGNPAQILAEAVAAALPGEKIKVAVDDRIKDAEWLQRSCEQAEGEQILRVRLHEELTTSGVAEPVREVGTLSRERTFRVTDHPMREERLLDKAGVANDFNDDRSPANSVDPLATRELYPTGYTAADQVAAREQQFDEATLHPSERLDSRDCRRLRAGEREDWASARPARRKAMPKTGSNRPPGWPWRVLEAI
jgi:hypothetical protein